MSMRLVERSRALFGAKIKETHSFHGDDTIVVDAVDIHEVLSTLRSDADARLDFLVDLTAVDLLGMAKLPETHPRFEVVYHLRSMSSGERLRVKARLADPEDGSNPALASVVDLWKSADWMERETYDMFGIKFTGHPDLRRILMYEEFIGYPLRKDYPKEKRQPLVRRDPNT
jgi:NADH-quinone oxidoreductase subunit C